MTKLEKTTISHNFNFRGGGGGSEIRKQKSENIIGLGTNILNSFSL